MLATLFALVALVVIGMISWSVVRGIPGIGLCAAVGAAAGALLRGPGSRAARVKGGLVGGLVAGYFAVASAERYPPGTIEWALNGSALAASFALPIAAIAGGVTELSPRRD
jgi:hypothetical protein